ncbi:MAG: glycosyltransferase [Candidatus Dadabacteria bacterium]|nr:MAG: glycosyltransferase [Candidatus Dadabacteria bacterium]
MDLSIVIPVYNERENLEQLHGEILAAVRPLGLSYEVIYVDDGSTDGSREILRRIHAEDPSVHVIRFRRNFGQTAAVAAGLSASRGDVVVTLDGDLQNDPADIPRLLDKLAEGYDMVSGWRRKRQDGFLLRRLPSVIANWIIRVTTNVNVHDYGCMLKAYRGDIARGLRLYGEMHRFIPAIAGDLGASIAELEVHHRPRIHGTSKYGISRTIRVVLDLLTVKFLSGFSTRPIHVFGFLGMLLGGVGSVMLAWLGGQKLFLGVQLGGRPIVLLAILLVVLGVQFVTMGLLGEMLARTYHESQGKPIYVVGEDLPPRADDTGGRTGEAGGATG